LQAVAPSDFGGDLVCTYLPSAVGADPVEGRFHVPDQPAPSLQTASAALRRLVELIDEISPLVPEEVALARRYRDDAAYRARFDAELARARRKPDGRPEWPVGFEHGPINERFDRNLIPRIWEELAPHAEDGAPHEVLFVAILDALGDYQTMLSVIRRVNSLCLDPEGKLDLQALCDKVTAARSSDWSDCEFARNDDPNEELIIHQEAYDLEARRLRRYCVQALSLIESVSRLRVDGSTFTVHWGGRSCELGVSQQFRLIRALADSRGVYVPFATLAERMGGNPDDSIAHVKMRLVKALQDAGMSDLADRIHTQRGHYKLDVP
jgi:hypothetical protein